MGDPSSYFLLYQYALNEPINSIDASGLKSGFIYQESKGEIISKRLREEYRDYLSRLSEEQLESEQENIEEESRQSKEDWAMSARCYASTPLYLFMILTPEGASEILALQKEDLRLAIKHELLAEELGARYSIILEDIISGKRKIMDKPDDYLKELKSGREFSTTPSLAVSVSSYKQLYMMPGAARYGGGRQDESTFDPRFTFDPKVQMSELELIIRIR